MAVPMQQPTFRAFRELLEKRFGVRFVQEPGHEPRLVRDVNGVNKERVWIVADESRRAQPSFVRSWCDYFRIAMEDFLEASMEEPS